MIAGLLWGLLGATFIGVSDCIARVTTPKVRIALLLTAVMGLSSIALGLYAALGDTWPVWHPYGWAACAGSGLLTLLALAFLYTALARGPVAVASPAASVFSVLLVAMNVAAGAPFVWPQGLAVLAVFFGVAMLARGTQSHEPYDAAHIRGTAALGLAAGFTVAFRMFLAQEGTDALGVMPALLLNRVFSFLGALVLVAVLWARGERLRLPRGRIGVLVLVQAALESLALGSFLTGSQGDGRIAASIGFAAFAAVTAITAWLWLGEKIGARRALWMALVAAGIVTAVAGAPG